MDRLKLSEYFGENIDRLIDEHGLAVENKDIVKSYAIANQIFAYSRILSHVFEEELKSSGNLVELVRRLEGYEMLLENDEELIKNKIELGEKFKALCAELIENQRKDLRDCFRDEDLEGRD